MQDLNAAATVSESDKNLLLELKRVVTKLVPDARLVVYGSVARGTRQPDSDYDVLVLTGRRLQTDEYRRLDRAIYDLQLEREAILSVMVWSRAEWRNPILKSSPYRKNVMREGIAI